MIWGIKLSEEGFVMKFFYWGIELSDGSGELLGTLKLN